MTLHKRTLIKATTWELSGIIVLGVINLCVFGQLWTSAWVAFGYGILRLIMYYFHERLWKKNSWGKEPLNNG